MLDIALKDAREEPEVNEYPETSDYFRRSIRFPIKHLEGW